MATIEFKTGDILQADAEALVNTVNCVGVMGRGLALQFKNTFPANFAAYAQACNRKELEPGHMFWFATGFLGNPKYIVNFPTKRHWRGKSRLEDISTGLRALASDLLERGVRSIAIPPLGSGLGGLDWADVRPLIAKSLESLPNIQVQVFEPRNEAGDTLGFRQQNVPTMTPGRAALVELVRRYLNGLLDPTVSLLEVHKLMYFMQEAGEPLKLKYVKGPYGPYAENLRHVLKEIEGHFLSGYADGGDAPDKELHLVPGAEEDAQALLRSLPESMRRFEKVSELVEGFESPYGLELLATAHWVATREQAMDASIAVDRIHAWSDRKKQYSSRQVELAINALSKRGWIAESVPGLGSAI
jgi:O-acetyl-ADP-ribose deacetylase (regulator of RNase III)